MRNHHRDAIERAYNLHLTNVEPGPRGFVAETYILHADKGERYFCKIVSKPVFVAQLRRSVPVLHAIHALKFDRIPYPILTSNGSPYFEHDGSLIALFNYIDAPQSYDYDNFAFGELTARTHQLVSALDASVLPHEEFVYEHQSDFEELFLSEKHALNSEPIAQAFQEVVRQHRLELLRYYQQFAEVAMACRNSPRAFVVTHGDSPGNTLVKTPTDLYVIDWDDIKLAPPERDTWFLDNKPEFLAGYRSIFPDYSSNELVRTFCILNYHFASIIHYCNEIFSEHESDYRRSNLEKLIEYLSPNSWIYSYLQQIKKP